MKINETENTRWGVQLCASGRMKNEANPPSKQNKMDFLKSSVLRLFPFACIGNMQKARRKKNTF